MVPSRMRDVHLERGEVVFGDVEAVFLGALDQRDALVVLLR
jgi:hypothetical protein